MRRHLFLRIAMDDLDRAPKAAWAPLPPQSKTHAYSQRDSRIHGAVLEWMKSFKRTFRKRAFPLRALLRSRARGPLALGRA